jgi:hypothetical protein
LVLWAVAGLSVLLFGILFIVLLLSVGVLTLLECPRELAGAEDSPPSLILTVAVLVGSLTVAVLLAVWGYRLAKRGERLGGDSYRFVFMGLTGLFPGWAILVGWGAVLRGLRILKVA